MELHSNLDITLGDSLAFILLLKRRCPGKMNIGLAYSKASRKYH